MLSFSHVIRVILRCPHTKKEEIYTMSPLSLSFRPKFILSASLLLPHVVQTQKTLRKPNTSRRRRHHFAVVVAAAAPRPTPHEKEREKVGSKKGILWATITRLGRKRGWRRGME